VSLSDVNLQNTFPTPHCGNTKTGIMPIGWFLSVRGVRVARGASLADTLPGRAFNAQATDMILESGRRMILLTVDPQSPGAFYCGLMLWIGLPLQLCPYYVL
jgi:hypothetical protein